MPIKDLLVPVDVSPPSRNRLEFTLSIAAEFSAQATAVALIPEPFLPPYVGAHLPAEVLQRQLEDAQREADEALAGTADAARRRQVPLATARITASVDRLAHRFACLARHVDLCIVGQPSDDHRGIGTAALVEAAFLESGRPALVVPAAGPAPRTTRRQVLVAWDGSREAARAVHDALPFLLGAERTTVLAVDADPRTAGESGPALVAHLARHGARAEFRAVGSAGENAGKVLLAQAAQDGADLLVMGGYGHSRMRELVLGGATRHVLARATLPVLISH